MEDDFAQAADFYLRLSFSQTGALLYNSLLENIREIKSIVEVRKQIKRLFESSCFHSAIV